MTMIIIMAMIMMMIMMMMMMMMMMILTLKEMVYELYIIQGLNSAKTRYPCSPIILNKKI